MAAKSLTAHQVCGCRRDTQESGRLGVHGEGVRGC
jgi:hypothetical protein